MIWRLNLLVVLVCFSYLTLGCDTAPQQLPPAYVEIPDELEGPLPGGVPTTDRSSEERHAEAALVQADVKRMLDATYGGDVDTLLDLTHPKLIELQGGKDAVKATLTTFLIDMRAKGIQLKSMEFPASPTFLAGQTNEFVIIPTLSVVAFPHGQRIESLNYQLGIRRIGETRWTYAEGSRMNQETVRDYFSDFPSDFTFPGTYRKKI